MVELYKLKAESETIQNQMAETKKSGRTNTLKEIKRLFKDSGFTVRMIKGALAKVRGEKCIQL